MVRGDREGLESMEIVAAFAYCPDDRQTLKFNCCIIVLSGIREQEPHFIRRWEPLGSFCSRA